MNTKIRLSLAGIALLLGLFSAAVASAQELHTRVTYLCNGERVLIESCNMRDQSDTSTCLVQHPDRPKHNGFVAYTNETRGTLKKLIATCKQPTADEVAHAEAFAKKQQDKQDAILQQNLKAMDTPVPPPGSASSGSSKSQRDKVRVARCLSAGRTEGQCVGNEFGKAFQGVFDFAGSMLGMKPPQAGLYLNGIYEGKGGWNISFAPDSVAMQCSDLVTDDHPYKIEFKGTQVVIKVETKPEPLVLAYREGKLYGSAPVKVDGAIVVGTIPGSGGGGGGSSNSVPGAMTSNTETTNSTRFVSPLEAQAYQRSGGSGSLQQSGAGYDLTESHTTTTYSAAPAPAPVYNTGPQIITAPRTRTCAAPALATTKTTTSQDMGSALSGLGALFDGGEAPKAAVAPTGLRMFGEYAAPGGADIDFKDDVAIVACGMIAAQYPYAVDLSGKEPVLRLASTGKLTIDLSFGPDRALVGSGSLQVTGRAATGEDRDGNIAYTSRSASCPLGTLKPVSENSGDTATESVPTAPPASAATSAASPAASKSAGPAFSKPSAPTGNAVLSIATAFPAAAGVANPLAGRPYLWLRDTLATALTKGGATIPAGVSAHKAVKDACASQRPDCRKYLLAISADTATGLASDANGKVTLPGVPPGIYYLMVSNQKNTTYWELKLQLKSGPNSATLDQRNAVPLN
jgi:hypothetical protein